MTDIEALEARAKQIKHRILNQLFKRRHHPGADRPQYDDAHARWEHAVRLREDGLTFREIGRRFGVTPSRAMHLVANGQRRRKIAARGFVGEVVE